MNDRHERKRPAFFDRTRLTVTGCVRRMLFFLPRLLGCLVFMLLGASPSLVIAIQPVRAELGETTAWTGEAVPLIVTLYSPGPFSGTAAFELPQLPRTAFVKIGNPLVGSEQVNGESYLTQRHEFAIHTQQSGEIVIPSFRVRFSGKQSFTSEPEPMEGATTELRFESKQPPGTASWEVVVSATAMKIEQTWNPLPGGDIQAGDIIVRTITRTAEGTTAMMLPQVSTAAPEGVQVYSAVLDVQDTIQRGEAKATRTDSIKYQFQHSGRFTLPALTFEWWDPKLRKVQSESLTGLEINAVAASVAAQPLEETPTGRRSVWLITAFGLLLVGLVAWLVHQPVGRWLVVWRAHRNRPDAVALRKLRTACAANDAAAAYAALIAWFAARRASEETDVLEQQPLREPFRELSRHLFAESSTIAPWRGDQFWEAFSQRQRQSKGAASVSLQSSLPPLNPTGR